MGAGDFLLTIETSSNQGTVALTRGTEIFGDQIHFVAGRGNGASLYPPIESLLKRLDDEAGSLEAVLVGTGPGNYSGVRIALATGLGIATGREVPLYGRGSFESYAETSGLSNFWGVGDARRGRFFRIKIRAGKQADAVDLMSEDEMRAWLELAEAENQHFVALDGVERFPNSIAKILQSSELISVSASGLALAFNRLDEQTREQSLNPQPFYLRGANITPAIRKSPLSKF